MTDENDSRPKPVRPSRRRVLYVLATLLVAALVYVLSQSAGGGVLANDLILDETLALHVSKAALRRVNVNAETAERLAEMIRSARVIDSRSVGGRLTAFVNQFRRPLPIPTSTNDRQIEFKSQSGRTSYVNVHDSTNDLMVYRSRPNVNLKTGKPATLFDHVAVCLLDDADAFRSLFDKAIADATSKSDVPLNTVPDPQPTESR